MGLLTLGELQRCGGLGQGAIIADVIKGVIDPLAQAGSSAYSTYAQSDLLKKQLKVQQEQQRAEIEQRQREAEIEARYAPVRAQTISTNVQKGITVVAVLGLTWGAVKIAQAIAGRGRGG